MSVIHYDLPEDHKAYIHRSGRTARAGRSGIVLSFVPPDQKKKTRRLQHKINIDQPITEPDIEILKNLSPVNSSVKKFKTPYEERNDTKNSDTKKSSHKKNSGQKNKGANKNKSNAKHRDNNKKPRSGNKHRPANSKNRNKQSKKRQHPPSKKRTQSKNSKGSNRPSNKNRKSQNHQNRNNNRKAYASR